MRYPLRIGFILSGNCPETVRKPSGFVRFVRICQLFRCVYYDELGMTRVSPVRMEYSARKFFELARYPCTKYHARHFRDASRASLSNCQRTTATTSFTQSARDLYQTIRVRMRNQLRTAQNWAV